jgi:ElaB/YqjD/DUF883 family membrane-anchored ribosome-binding protein
MTPQASPSSQKLVTDFRVLLADAEELARATAAQTGEKITDLRSRIQQEAAAIKPKLERAEAVVKDAAGKTDAYVRANAWATAGVAAGIGFVLGVLLSRR